MGRSGLVRRHGLGWTVEVGLGLSIWRGLARPGEARVGLSIWLGVGWRGEDSRRGTDGLELDRLVGTARIGAVRVVVAVGDGKAGSGVACQHGVEEAGVDGHHPSLRVIGLPGVRCGTAS